MQNLETNYFIKEKFESGFNLLDRSFYHRSKKDPLALEIERLKNEIQRKKDGLPPEV